MTVIADFVDLAAGYRRMASGFQKAQDGALKEAALIVEASVAAASGPYRGKKIVATRSTVSGDTAVVRMTSRKAHLLDHDTKAHGEAPRRRSVLGGPRLSHPISGAISHPGTKGKHMWEEGVAAAEPLIGKALQDEVTGVYLGAFGLL